MFDIDMSNYQEDIMIWRCPKLELPVIIIRIVHEKYTIHVWGTPILGNPFTIDLWNLWDTHDLNCASQGLDKEHKKASLTAEWRCDHKEDS